MPASLAAVALYAACGGGGSGGGPTDAGSDVANDVIHYGFDAAPDAGVSIPPSGTQLVVTTNPLQLYAVTSDGYAIYADTTDTSLHAVSVMGGMPQTISASVGANAAVIADGPVVLIWANLNASNIGQFMVWTAAKGPQMLSNASLVAGSVSKDQTHVAFLDKSTAASTAIAVAGVDGTGMATLVPTATITAACPPNVGWVGNDVLAAHCGGSDAGSSTTPTLTRFTGATWTPTIVSASTGGTAFAANSTADHVLYFGAGAAPTPADGGAPEAGAPEAGATEAGATEAGAGGGGGGLVAYAVASGMSQVIDPNGDSFVITPDGTKVVYGTTATTSDGGLALGPFKVTPIASPSPTTLGTGIFAFSSISPDGNWVLGFSQQNAMATQNNVFLASATMAGTPQMLVAQPTSSSIGDSWTTDSKFAIYTDTITATTTAAGMVTSGNLNVVALTAGAMPMPLGTMVWQDAAGPGSKIVFNPNWNQPTNTGFGTADLMEIDMSQASPKATTLVTQADANFFMTSDKKTIIYSYSNGGTGRATAQSGLWALPTP